MNNAVFNFDVPQNEPIYEYSKDSKEREALVKELDKQASEKIDIPLIIGGKEVRTGDTGNVVMPHLHSHVLATYHRAGKKEVSRAIDEAKKAKDEWMNMSWTERASIMLKAAELLSKKYRYLINASTMLGQGKNAFQAEIDAACETIDFLRFNANYISIIYNEQPKSSQGILNRMEYRPLEGFIYTISPFNFTAIASNLNMAPCLMGNTMVWKPASTSLLSNYYLMKIFMEAGIPAGVINFLPGSGSTISEVALSDRELSGIHFTGSNATFNTLWKTVAQNLDKYRSYPKVVGETGGKDFIFAHCSAIPEQVATAIVRGAFEYQGQKCSAASRAYIPRSMWKQVKEKIISDIGKIKIGDVRDFTNFVNAVIDKNSFDNIVGYIENARKSPEADIIAGGKYDDGTGYFIHPTVIEVKNPHFITMEEEMFGPVMSIFVYDDDKYEETLKICDSTSPYGLTGSIFSQDRSMSVKACRYLRYAAGNFYYNDKPTGAMVGQQPFGGSRASGTNDKSGSYLNLLRWTNPRTVKETFLPPENFEYDYMKE
ncbi:L-glutamate gamma-semialdehyde dehydrogenase [candidate division WOR-3 bacterium]|nr:L-glutamate gamma-semialdehyde dehydrogenase [candidate division WOR-3 bacterium]